MLHLSSELEKKLLTYFFLNPKQKLYLQEISRKLNLDPGNLDKKLKKLEKQNIFLSEFQGKQRYYFLNEKFPLFKEYQSIINKTYGVENLMAKIVSKIPNVKLAYIFGSYAKGVFDEFSDIDLLIVGEFNTLHLSQKLHKLEKLLGREINTVEMDPKEFKNRQKKGNELLNEIFSNPHIQIV